MARQTINFFVEAEGTIDEKAYWSNADPTIPIVQSFREKVNIFINAKIVEGTIKAGFVIAIDNDNKKALATAITVSNVKKDALIYESAPGVLAIIVL